MLAVSCLIVLASMALAKTISVDIGNAGLKIEPNVVFADKGDIISFEFYPGVRHLFHDLHACKSISHALAVFPWLSVHHTDCVRICFRTTPSPKLISTNPANHSSMDSTLATSIPRLTNQPLNLSSRSTTPPHLFGTIAPSSSTVKQEWWPS